MAPASVSWAVLACAHAVLGGIPDRTWPGHPSWHHEELWTQLTTPNEGVTTDCAYLGSLVPDSPDDFPSVCRSRALALGGDTFEARADSSKCYFKRCRTSADIKFTDKFGGRQTYTILVGGWSHVMQASEGLGIDCPSLGEHALPDPSQSLAACQSRAMHLGGDSFDLKPDGSRCHVKRCGRAEDLSFSSSSGASDSYTLLRAPYIQITQAADGVSTACPYLGSHVVSNASRFPAECYFKAAGAGADTFDARPDGSKCYFKRCGSMDDVRYTGDYGARSSFTTLGGRWSQITRSADGQSTDCTYLGSYVLADPSEFPQACYSKTLVQGGNTFDVKADGSKCYFKKCKSLADMKFTDSFGARESHTTLVDGWSRLTLAREGLSTDCEFLGDYVVTDASDFPLACFSRSLILGGDTFDARPDGSKCYFKRCRTFADIKFTDKYGARSSYTLLFPRGGDDWGPCDPAVCLDFHLMYTSKVNGRFLPVGGAGETCDPADSETCFGGTARRISYVEQKKEEFARRNESVTFLDMGGSTFGGPVWGLEGYPIGRPATVLQNLIPYDMCLFSPRDFLNLDEDKARLELAESFGNRTCNFIMSNAKFNGMWSGFNAKVSPWVVKEMLNGWKVAFLGMFPHVNAYGSNYGPGIVDVDSDGVLARVMRADLTDLKVSVAELNQQLLQYNGDYSRLDPHLQDVVLLGSMVSINTLIAAAEARRAHPDLKAMVLLAGDSERFDQMEWLARHGDFDVILRESRKEDPILIKSKMGPKQVLLAGGETIFGVGHLKVRLSAAGGVEKFEAFPDVSLDSRIPSNRTVEAIMSDLYSVIRQRNALPFGRLVNPLVGGSRGDEAPPSMFQCYYMECNIATVVGRAFLWKARSQGHRADVSLYNLGGLRSSLKGDANGTVFITHCIDALKFQNTLETYRILGKDLYESIKRLMLPEERGFIGAGVRVTFHEPCYDFVDHANFVHEQRGPPGSTEEIERCYAAKVADANIKVIEMEVAHVDWASCSDYTNCEVEWRPLEKGTTYTIVSSDYLQSILVGFTSTEISLGTDAEAVCEYVAAHSPLEVDDWESYFRRGSRRYSSSSEAWSEGLRVASVSIATSVVEFAPTCPDGMHLPTRAQACMPCPAGSQSIEEADRSACRVCALGFYSNRSGMATCLPCAAGYFAARPGSTGCNECPAGTVSDTGAIYCNDCRPGQYAAAAATRDCAPCAVGTYASAPRSTSCDACGKGLVTKHPAAFSAEECLCPDGKYYRPLGALDWAAFRNGSLQASTEGECWTCPKGMTCPLGSDVRFLGARSASLRQFPKLLPRHWSSAEDPLSIFACRSELKCPGGEPGNACGPSLQLRACEYCNDGSYWTGETCRLCTSSTALFPILPLGLVPPLVTLLYFTSRDPMEKWGTWKNAIACQIFILVNFYQTLGLMREAAVVLPDRVEGSYSPSSSLTNLREIYRSNCVSFESFEAGVITDAVSPIIVITIGLLTMVLSWQVARWRGKESMRMKFTGVHHVLGSLLFTFFSGIAARALTLFKCADNPNGLRTLTEDASIICYDSGPWHRMLIVGIASVVLYCCVVGAAFIRAVLIAPKDGNFKNPDFQWRWKFLFIKYRADVYWFGVVHLFKNVLVNLAFVIFQTGVLQLYWIMFMISAYGGLVVTFKPYRYRAAYLLELVATVCMVYCCSFLTWFAGRPDPESNQTVAYMAIVTACAPLVVSAGCVAQLLLSKVLFGQAATHKGQEERFAALKFSCCHLVRLPNVLGSELMAEIGEWDRKSLEQFNQIIATEVLGEGGYRMSSGVIFMKHMNEAAAKVRKSAVATVRGLASSKGSQIGLQGVNVKASTSGKSSSGELKVVISQTSRASCHALARAAMEETISSMVGASDSTRSFDGIAQRLCRGDKRLQLAAVKALAQMAAAGDEEAIEAASQLLAEEERLRKRDSACEVVELRGAGDSHIVSTSGVQNMII